jgi:hypothetical protein
MRNLVLIEAAHGRPAPAQTGMNLRLRLAASQLLLLCLSPAPHLRHQADRCRFKEQHRARHCRNPCHPGVTDGCAALRDTASALVADSPAASSACCLELAGSWCTGVRTGRHCRDGHVQPRQFRDSCAPRRRAAWHYHPTGQWHWVISHSGPRTECRGQSTVTIGRA